MSQVSKCPKCQQLVPLPDGLDPNATVCCPLCQHQFVFQEASPSAAAAVPRDSFDSYGNMLTASGTAAEIAAPFAPIEPSPAAQPATPAMAPAQPSPATAMGLQVDTWQMTGFLPGVSNVGGELCWSHRQWRECPGRPCPWSRKRFCLRRTGRFHTQRGLGRAGVRSGARGGPLGRAHRPVVGNV